ncbi:hypothetical protein BGX24_005074, partial [Mortierella sp. AD032]
MTIIEEVEVKKAYHDRSHFSASRTRSSPSGPQVDPTPQGAATHAETVPPPPPTAPRTGPLVTAQAEPTAGSLPISQTHGPAGHTRSHKPKNKNKKKRRPGSHALKRRRQKWRRSRYVFCP